MLYLLKAATGFLPVFYTLVFCFYVSLLCAEESERRKKLASRLLTALVLVHLATLFLRGLVLEHCPLIGAFELVSFLALAIAATHLIIEKSTGSQSPGMAALAVAAVLQTIASAFGGYSAAFTESLESVLVHLHVFAGICAHAGFFTAAIYALLYLTLYRQIKVHQLNRIWRQLPPLEGMHRMSSRAVGMGLLFFTGGIAIGVIQAVVQELGIGPLVSSGVCWLIFAVLLAAGKIFRLSGRRFAVGTLIAATLELFLFFVTQSQHQLFMGN